MKETKPGSQAIHPLDVVIKKRDGGELSRAEIEAFVRAVVRNGEAAGTGVVLPVAECVPVAERVPLAACVSDAQIASFLMAVFQRGLSARELADLTAAMRFSGEVFEARELGAFTVDKHSTGGVGDKTSLLIAPIVAAAGFRASAAVRDMQIPSGDVKKMDKERGASVGVPSIRVPQLCVPQLCVPRLCVPMISGRALGHTGGTLDKLETIPGFDTQLSLERMAQVLRQCGAALVGQTPRLVPADRILYALRDHTGTVESPYLIAASIMSKKLAEDLRGLVLDVKVGSGAFMPTYAASQQLAELMVDTGTRAGTRTVALLTSMNEPLGRFAGNWVEVWECADILRGVRHPMSADLIELSCVLAGWMLHLASEASSPKQGARLADELLRSGEAYEAWLRIVRAQGGDASVFDNPAAFHKPGVRRTLRAPQAGFLSGMDCKEVGWAVQRLGAGRHRPGEPVSAHAGIEVHAKIGDRVEHGQPVFTLFSEEQGLLDELFHKLQQALCFAPTRPEPCPLVRAVLPG